MTRHRNIQNKLDDVRESTGCQRVAFLDVFEFERQPISALQKVKSGS